VELKDKNELLVWKVTFTGPADSPYDKGIFVLEVDLRQEYPFKVQFALFLFSSLSSSFSSSLSLSFLFRFSFVSLFFFLIFYSISTLK
jgi:hypothetical protein